MDYIIKNYKNVFIRINENGKPITCTEKTKGLFEYSKAKNIVDNLPKTLKKLNFKVEAVPDFDNQSKKVDPQPKVIQNENYTLEENVSRWIERFGICDDIINEAKSRRKELIVELSNIDKELSNMVHEIEFKKSIDLYTAWKEIKKIQDNCKRRRCVKDELLIISSVSKLNFKCLSSESIEKAVAGLATRKFTYRVVEGDEKSEVM